MDSVGTLQLEWAQGYDGGQASYINRDTICFRCGNNVKFMNEDGHTNIFPSEGNGLGAIAVHPVNKVFAVADVGLEPSIKIYEYPIFKLVSELKGGAVMDYQSLVFSHSDYIATVTAVPDFQLVFWNYVTGKKLCTYDLKKEAPTALTINPANWREMCISYVNELSLYKIEQSNAEYIIQKHKMKLPAEDSSSTNLEEDADRDHEVPTRASTRMSRVSVKLPVTSVAGVKGQEAEQFQEYRDMSTRVKPRSHCWLPSGDVLIGCQGGQVIKVDGETFKVRVVYNPGPRPGSSVSRLQSANLAGKGIPEANESASSIDVTTIMADGSVNCLALHKKGLFAGGVDGTLRKLELVNDSIRVVGSHALGTPITSLSFNTMHTRIAIGSEAGCIDVADPTDLSTCKQLFSVHCGKFVAVDMIAPGIGHCVTARELGEIQIWSVENNSQPISSISLGVRITAMAASPFGHLVVVGCESGHLYYLDVTKIDRPRIIERRHMHSGPLRRLVFNKNGQFLLSGSDDGHIYVMDGRCASQFKCLGFVALQGDVEGIDTFFMEKTEKTKVVVTANATEDKTLGATRIMHFTLPHDLDRDIEIKHQSLKWELKDSLIEKLVFNFANPSHSIAIGDPNVVFTLTANTKKLHKLQLPNEPPKKEQSKDSYLLPVIEAEGHGLSGGKLVMSSHGKWLGSVGADGKMTIRAVGNLERPISLNAHDFQLGGACDLVFTSDTFRLLSVGADGSLVCYKWNFHASYEKKAKAAQQFVRDLEVELQNELGAENTAIEKSPEWQPESLSTARRDEIDQARQKLLEKERAIEKAIEADTIFKTPTPVPGADATWMQVKELEAHEKENLQYADVKSELRGQIRDIRRQLQAMMTENEGVPDIERLEHHDFDLDVEEQQRLQKEGDAEVARIREEKELENLAKMYVADLIKQECWDNMAVKGRGITAFRSDLEVHNYPMRKRSQEELDKLEIVKERRRMEIAEATKRREIAEIHSKTVDDEENGEEEDAKGEKPSTTGSLGAQYGGGSELLYSQFELHTREEKANQIVLLEDAMHRIREAFNKEFNEVYSKKENEIAKIKEKNKRIRKIINDLDFNESIYEPEMGIVEKPEQLLTVSDDEVKVEKYLTPEQQAKQETERKVEEERRAREKRDNWRERGLDRMMGGLLEVKKEDELKKDIPKPAFMTAKKEDDWSDDEKKLAQEYERKVKELIEEREKYRKQLEMELKKLQGLIQDSTDQFDETLKQLFMRKIKTEMVIYQEELKIVRLKYSLLIEEEFHNREVELMELVQHKRILKGLAGKAATESKKHVDAYRDMYETLLAEEKVIDKEFRGKFDDTLTKSYRRRPRGQKVRGNETPIYDPSSGNPFGDRPSTARQNLATQRSVEAAMKELDSEKNCPDHVKPETWKLFCAYRRKRIESERHVQVKALVLAEMQAFLQRRHEEEERLGSEIEDLTEATGRLREDRNRFMLNLEVQLLLKQGQVEVDQGYFIPNYRESLLIHRNVVEDLNGKVRALGTSKITSMEESMEFRKGIVMLEWEHKKMTMEMEDLQNKMRDVQNMKVTREIQLYLNETNHEERRAKEISVLEETLVMLKQHHEKSVEEKKKIMKELKRSVKERDHENGELENELEELNVSVNERRHIHEVNAPPPPADGSRPPIADKRSDAGQEQRYREIVQRRKLVDLAKAQAQEVAVLRAEVERLRMRTFPALVQVEH